MRDWKATVRALKALPLPRATSEQFSIGGASATWNAGYVSQFLPPRLKGKCGEVLSVLCVGCGECLSSDFEGTFVWGLAHGEGYCSTCGYPTKLYHYAQDDAGSDVGRVSFPLQWHPDEIPDEAVRASLDAASR